MNDTTSAQLNSVFLFLILILRECVNAIEVSIRISIELWPYTNLLVLLYTVPQR